MSQVVSGGYRLAIAGDPPTREEIDTVGTLAEDMESLGRIRGFPPATFV